MATMVALMAVEDFEDWLNQAESRHRSKLSEMSEADKRVRGEHAYQDYEEAHETWLSSRGLDKVACDYGTAVEVLLIILSKPPNEWVAGMPASFDDGHAWEHMTETGFRRLVYQWQNGAPAASA